MPVPAESPIEYASSGRIFVARPADVTTLGVDPMVSQASVIHELAYGRIETELDVFPVAKGIAYPAQKEETVHSVDILI
ncbi:MAG: hypothetical protein ACP5G0_04765 [Desulfomonilia bacterium]